MSGAPTPPWPAKPALFLDLDGTLVEIVDHPDSAAASPRLRALLGELPAATGGAVALISGRRIEELDRILAPHAYVAAGVHGLQRRSSDGRVVPAADAQDVLRPARAMLEPLAAAHDGLWIEDKGAALALHYRNRPELESEIHSTAADLQDNLPPDVELLLGNKVLELKPRVMNKGSAIAAFMDEAPFAGRTPVFLGDDVTDEAGFRVVNALGGVSVKVGSGDTLALWRLADVEAVLGWLERAVEGRLPAAQEGAWRDT